MKYSKFEQKIRDRVVSPYIDQQSPSGVGIVLLYSPENNTASILMSKPGTNLPGEVYRDVPCPTSIGVQTVNPGRGRQCWVNFVNNDPKHPYITHFYNNFYSEKDLPGQSTAISPLPRFIYNL